MTDLATETPYVAVAEDGLPASVCSYCFAKSTLIDIFKCKKCKILHYCSSACQTADWYLHKAECRFLVPIYPKIPSRITRIMTRLLIRRKKGDEKKVVAFNGRTFGDLMDHYEEISAHDGYMNLFRSVKAELEKFVEKEYLVDDERLLRYFGKYVINGISIKAGLSGSIGWGVYIGLSVHDHSCRPDAFFRFKGGTLVLRTPAFEGVEYSKELKTSYCDLDMTRKERQEILNQYFFKCDCEACTDDDYEGLARSVYCDRCEVGVCPVVEGLEELKCVNCGEACGITPEHANHINDMAIEFLNKIQRRFTVQPISFGPMLDFYKRSEVILSERNIMRARLADRLVTRFLINMNFGHFIEYLYPYHEMMSDFVPKGYADLAYYYTSAAQASFQSGGPDKAAEDMLKELATVVLITHGWEDEPAEANKDPEKAGLYKAIHNMETMVMLRRLKIVEEGKKKRPNRGNRPDDERDERARETERP